MLVWGRVGRGDGCWYGSGLVAVMVVGMGKGWERGWMLYEFNFLKFPFLSRHESTETFPAFCFVTFILFKSVSYFSSDPDLDPIQQLDIFFRQNPDLDSTQEFNTIFLAPKATASCT